MTKDQRNKKAFRINKKQKESDCNFKKFMKRLRIQIIDDPVKKAISNYKMINYDNSTSESFYNNKDFLERILLNFIRHEHTNYMLLVEEIELKNRLNKSIFKKKVNESILKKYREFL